MLSRPQIIAAALVAVGALSMAVAGRRTPPPDLPMANPYVAKSRERLAAIEELVKEQPGMTTRDKIERAYDGAVHTHEIGFPDSAVSKPR